MQIREPKLQREMIGGDFDDRNRQPCFAAEAIGDALFECATEFTRMVQMIGGTAAARAGLVRCRWRGSAGKVADWNPQSILKEVTTGGESLERMDEVGNAVIVATLKFAELGKADRRQRGYGNTIQRPQTWPPQSASG